MPALSKASDIAVSAWSSQSHKILLYGQSDDGTIHEYKYDDGQWTHLGHVAKARPATPIAVTSNRKDWIRVFFLDEHRRVIQAANKGSSWELKVWPVTLHAASRLAARNDGDKGYRAFGQAENGDLIEMTRNKTSFSWKVISKRAVPGTCIAVPQNGLNRLYFSQVPQKYEHEGLFDIFPGLKNDICVKAVKTVGDWVTNLIPAQQPDMELVAYKSDGPGSPWTSTTLATAKPNMQIAVTDCEPGLDLLYTNHGKVYELRKDGFNADISDGPVAIVNRGGNKVAAFWHDAEDPTKIDWAEGTPGSLHPRRAFN
ncbi:hypothetical protein BGW36DRAFT_371047 [Talaromyces proteolyticus]|uniref:Fucose-specific lectin n=1 Tax=Talaromyces proteolyticus TaxID=1131652 RepID=A0AAD4Q379_9EURO|nr:uncharacterized protein BGW36DRAFT_371047 [Talaromyces proteolyticus]KAH8701497.1 hypothetical protein BGW36DRAFT_371047 [Talaromyces proteolyticus]